VVGAYVALSISLAGCGDDATPRDGGPGRDAAVARDAGADGSGALDADETPRDSGPPPGPSLELRPITRDHRFVPDAMFGGWGPHLGHLVEIASELVWIDDLCDQEVRFDCSVNTNRRLGLFQRDGAAWVHARTVTLREHVQQNTATITDGRVAWTFGIDVRAGRVIECRHEVETSACDRIPIDTGPSANYVGAAIAPSGWRVVWWTNVVDGGGGSFSFLVDYGGGWNGPRTGPIGGYNDCAYAHVAFAPAGDAATFFCQVVAGFAPSWTFGTLVGEARLGADAPVAWRNALAAPPGDSVTSTNDLWIDPATGDAHLLARSELGAALYHHRPPGGEFALARTFDATFRARWLVTADTIALVTGPNAGGITVYAAERSATVAGSPLDLALRLEAVVAGGLIQGIYPLASAYQRSEPSAPSFAIVTADRQFEAVGARVVW
jgi:hypothetical protein